MIYRDTIALVKPVDGIYDQSGGERNSVKCVVEQTSGLTRGGSYDAMTGDARAYLDADDVWLKSTAYQIEGYFAEVDLLGLKTVYRVSNVSIGRAVVTTGRVKHIEVELSRIDKELG